jgi:hypothetical protein
MGVPICKNSKGIYADGHEPQDVVEYRKTWTRQMMIRNKLMESYQGHNMDIVIVPNLDTPWGGNQQKCKFFFH